MTETAVRTRAGITARIWVWVRRCQGELSARVYAAGDEEARRHGWTVTRTTGRFGFEARSYRDPRFEGRRRQLGPGAGLRPTPSEAAPVRETGEWHGCT
jgi:hypothetical protein